MGWGILASPRDDDDCYVAFFCNTSDEAFGPLLSVRGTPKEVKRAFYANWDNACREVQGSPIDPRSYNPLLYQISYLTFALAGIDPHYTREEYDEMFGAEAVE
jgi:hypothetical protein